MNRHKALSIAIALTLGLSGARVMAHQPGESNHDQDEERMGIPQAASTEPRPAPRSNLAEPRLTPLLQLVIAQGATLNTLPEEGHEATRDWMVSVFRPFLPKVRTRFDDQFLYVESDGMPEHRMMVGITAWQQQVPLPQRYEGANAWRIPRHPVVAANPLSARTHFFRGAIALAANGVPIFNPIKNDGRTDTLLAGELDEFGGHCGRADDYHYHTAPTHLQDKVGRGLPIAIALDGYPIYGFTDPDGTTPGDLDPFNGHSRVAIGYHYHATRTYPYLNGAFYGQVAERDGQVDPQPRALGVRPALTPWRGARITGFQPREGGGYRLEVRAGGEAHFIDYTATSEGGVTFRFTNPEGQVRTENYPGRRDSSPGRRVGGASRRERAD